MEKSERNTKRARKEKVCSKCKRVGHSMRNKNCPLFGVNSSDVTQNLPASSSSENVPIPDDEDDEEENVSIPPLADDSDSDDEIEDDADDWLASTIHPFQPRPLETPRSSSRRSSSSPTDIDPPNDNIDSMNLMPPFSGYRIGRGDFQGPNKKVINDAECGESTLIAKNSPI